MTLAYLPPIISPGKRGGELIIHAHEVEYGGERRQFAAVNRYTHRGDPRWVPNLPYARQDALRSGNPLFQGENTGFLGIARNLGLGDEAVGAIAARAEAGEEEGAVGRWGLFDSINVAELAEQLFFQAETWLFEHTPGITALSGPGSMEPLTPPGMLVDGFDAWPAALLPYNPPYYPELVEAEGYEQGRSWSAWRLACLPQEGRSAVRDAACDWEAVAEIYGATADNNHAPAMRSWLAHLAGGNTFPAHPHLRWILAQAFRKAVCVTAQDDKGAGVCFGIPDFAPALRLTGGRLFPVGYALFLFALARARRLRVFPAAAPKTWSVKGVAELYTGLARKASARGFAELLIAPIFDDDETSAEAISNLGAQVVQRFSIYEKTV